MIAVYRVEPIKGGFVAHVACDVCSGFAQGRSRIRAIESAMVLVLRNVAVGLDAGDIAAADVMDIRFQEAASG